MGDFALSDLLAKDWWVPFSGAIPERGCVVESFFPYFGTMPFVLVARARGSPTAHASADVEIKALRPNQNFTPPSPPVAGLTLDAGEQFYVAKSKRRPALVVGMQGSALNTAIMARLSSWQRARAIIVAPMYGIDRNGKRGGWDPVFIGRVKACVYPQFAWDSFPGSSTDSLVRFDRLMPLTEDGNAFNLWSHKLSDEALKLVDQHVAWHLTGELNPTSQFARGRDELMVEAGFK